VGLLTHRQADQEKCCAGEQDQPRHGPPWREVWLLDRGSTTSSALGHGHTLLMPTRPKVTARLTSARSRKLRK
jgi:hypothetical protein